GLQRGHWRVRRSGENGHYRPDQGDADCSAERGQRVDSAAHQRCPDRREAEEGRQEGRRRRPRRLVLNAEPGASQFFHIEQRPGLHPGVVVSVTCPNTSHVMIEASRQRELAGASIFLRSPFCVQLGSPCPTTISNRASSRTSK